MKRGNIGAFLNSILNINENQFETIKNVAINSISAYSAIYGVPVISTGTGQKIGTVYSFDPTTLGAIVGDRLPNLEKIFPFNVEFRIDSNNKLQDITVDGNF